jgi:hypothetical protein
VRTGSAALGTLAQSNKSRTGVPATNKQSGAQVRAFVQWSRLP